MTTEQLLQEISSLNIKKVETTKIRAKKQTMFFSKPKKEKFYSCDIQIMGDVRNVYFTNKQNAINYANEEANRLKTGGIFDFKEDVDFILVAKHTDFGNDTEGIDFKNSFFNL